MVNDRGLRQDDSARLRDIVSYAGTHSAYFESRYRGVPEPLTNITQLPMTTKSQMTGHFDEWVTDPVGEPRAGGGVHRRSRPDRA